MITLFAAQICLHQLHTDDLTQRAGTTWSRNPAQNLLGSKQQQSAGAGTEPPTGVGSDCGSFI